MNESHTLSTRLWMGTLIVSTVLTPVFVFIVQSLGPVVSGLGDRQYQTFIFIAVCMALTALLAFRILVGRAMDTERPAQAYVLAGACLTASFALIAYGISSFV